LSYVGAIEIIPYSARGSRFDTHGLSQRIGSWRAWIFGILVQNWLDVGVSDTKGWVVRVIGRVLGLICAADRVSERSEPSESEYARMIAGGK